VEAMPAAAVRAKAELQTTADTLQARCGSSASIHPPTITPMPLIMVVVMMVCSVAATQKGIGRFDELIASLDKAAVAQEHGACAIHHPHHHHCCCLPLHPSMHGCVWR